METDLILVHKNRKRALGALAIILFMAPVSAWLLFLGLQPGRPDVGWSMVLFGALGLVVFLGSAALIIGILRAPWRLELTPVHLVLYTPTYDLNVPWGQIAGIAVDAVNRRTGCTLVFEETAEIVQGATFHHRAKRPDAVTDRATMRARMEENMVHWGYHLAIPGRILELGPEELAGLLTRARTGVLWREVGPAPKVSEGKVR